MTNNQSYFDTKLLLDSIYSTKTVIGKILQFDILIRLMIAKNNLHSTEW